MLFTDRNVVTTNEREVARQIYDVKHLSVPVEPWFFFLFHFDGVRDAV